MKLVPFNINNHFRVKLTAVGLQQHREAHKAIQRVAKSQGADIESDPWEYTPPEVDAEGWTRMQAWDVMRIWGAHMGNGFQVPFETTIEVEVDDARVVEMQDVGPYSVGPYTDGLYPVTSPNCIYVTAYFNAKDEAEQYVAFRNAGRASNERVPTKWNPLFVEDAEPVVPMQDEIAASLALVRAKLVRVEGADHEDEAQLVEAIAELRGIQEAVGGAHQYEDQFNGTAKCGACGGALEDPEHGQNWKPLPMTARIEGGVLTAYPRLPRDVRASLEWQQGPQTVAFAVMGDLSQGADDAPKKDTPEQPHADTARLNYLERKALEPSPHGYIALAIFPFTRTSGSGARGSRVSLADVAEEADDRLDEYAEGGTLREAIDAAMAESSAPKENEIG